MNHLQNKLSRYEAAPPGKVWDKIAEALDAEQDYAKRLYQFEQLPPANVWKKIETSLQTEAPLARVIPFTTRFRKHIRYASAAAIIMVVLVTATLVLKRTEAGSLSTQSASILPVVKKNKPKANEVLENKTQLPEQQVQTVSIEPQKINTVKIQRKPVSGIAVAGIPEKVVIAPHLLAAKINKGEINTFSWADDYMIYSDDEGNTMRVPKKLFSLFSCPGSDESCKQRIAELKQKLLANTAAGFAGLLEMLYQLQ